MCEESFVSHNAKTDEASRQAPLSAPASEDVFARKMNAAQHVTTTYAEALRKLADAKQSGKE